MLHAIEYQLLDIFLNNLPQEGWSMLDINLIWRMSALGLPLLARACYYKQIQNIASSS